jgi:hypothetical protein
MKSTRSDAGFYFVLGVSAAVGCLAAGHQSVPESHRAYPAMVLGLAIIAGCLFLGCAYLRARDPRS